ncbi:DUF3303 domain-containing protein [Bailinhaonella thermotolerans]|uniref:DUF3303 domain-containing protein n=1 Tax=Bailinhaonella thermotolerans TaxID=1070861 RepID=UPI00192A206E|nr:DUF3303 family protein [Bailinhaonella thermotolerans]
MKYVVQYKVRENTTAEAMQAGFAVYERWQPTKGIEYLQHVARVDGSGGFIVVETDDPSLIALDTATYSPYVSSEVIPVVDMEQFARTSNQAADLRASARQTR